MYITINFSSETPIYIQLRNQIIEGIASGKIKNSESLPSIRQLASDIGINMHTVNKVYSQLKRDGYIQIHRRKGVVVISEQLKRKSHLLELSDAVRPIIAESICHGISEDEFTKKSAQIFKQIKLENAQ